MKPELIFHGLTVLHGHGVPAAFMAFASNISSLFLLCLSWSLWNFRFSYLFFFFFLTRADRLGNLEFEEALCR